MILIQKDEASTIVFYPPVNMLKQPASAFVRVSTPYTAMPQVGDEIAATVESVSVTLNAETKKGKTSLSFATDPNFIVGHKYLLETVEGYKEIIEPLNSGSTVTLSQALPFTVGTGDTVKSLAISTTLTAIDTQTQGRGLVNAYAEFDGENVYWQQEFKIVDVVPRLTLNWTSLLEMLPECDRLRPRTNFEPQKIINAAWEMTLKPDLQNLGINLEYVKNWESLEHVHALAVVNNLTNSSDSNNTERVRQTWIRYNSALRKVVEASEFWYSSPLSSSQSTAEIDNSSIRLTR